MNKASETESENYQEIIQIYHCYIKTRKFFTARDGWIKADSRITWSLFGSDSRTASNREKIAFFICNLPSSNLCDFKHKDQIEKFISRKNTLINVARCFLAGRNQPDDPILKDLEDNLITQWQYDCTWLECKLYENLFELIINRGRQIKSVLKSKKWGYPFNSNLELTQEVIRSCIDGEFCMIFKKQYQYRTTWEKEVLKLNRKNYKSGLTKEETERLLSLINQLCYPSLWGLRVICAVEELIEKGDSLAQVRLQIHYSLLNGIYLMQMKAQCDPELKQYKERTHFWIDGEKTYGQIPGWKA